ncbi:unnamed protein product [Ceratitis capitata]|uniref:(Mediterranean fruit fly) hypothetical protein n=1 Tax=Ceratitis capitata TaxID=7213 RepID=A0A811UD05_CERCA|nr:unnamed protein product [Ceratitis capitata]
MSKSAKHQQCNCRCKWSRMRGVGRSSRRVARCLADDRLAARSVSPIDQSNCNAIEGKTKRQQQIRQQQQMNQCRNEQRVDHSEWWLRLLQVAYAASVALAFGTTAAASN